MPSSNAKQTIFSAAPILKVNDTVETAIYYRDVLGFEVDFTYGEPPTLISISRDDGQIFLSYTAIPNSQRVKDPDSGSDLYMFVADVDALFEEFRINDAQVLSEPTVYPYGMKDFEIEDCNGYVLCFGQELDD